MDPETDVNVTPLTPSGTTPSSSPAEVPSILNQEPPTPSFPPLSTQAANAARAAVRVLFATVGHNPVFVPLAEREQRYLICSTCPQFYGPTVRCQKCGCTLKVKLVLRTETCPLHHWP